MRIRYKSHISFSTVHFVNKTKMSALCFCFCTKEDKYSVLIHLIIISVLSANQKYTLQCRVVSFLKMYKLEACFNTVTKSLTFLFQNTKQIYVRLFLH